ncbi:hypothetical protein F4778DRAFT_121130 [Xylariomycetidae sp. FL2044]|nr:hypothetical protein F4778DRAFT_121130 [Xylariomycetidae sp. FL2044]
MAAASNNIFSAGNEDLLKSGNFCDVEVTCDSRTWKLHKSIICPRCPYFAKAFGGHLKEATTNTINIQGFHPQELNWFITFIYTGKSTHTLKKFLKNPQTLFPTCKAVINMADYFCLESFQTVLAPQLRKYFLESAKAVQLAASKNPDADPKVGISADFVEGFFILAEAIDGRKYIGPLRDIMVDYIAMTGYLVLKDKVFRTRLEKSPDLATAVLMRMAEEKDQRSRSMIIPRLPDSCKSCGTDAAFYPLTWYDESNTYGRCVSGVCENCNNKKQPDDIERGYKS